MTKAHITGHKAADGSGGDEGLEIRYRAPGQFMAVTFGILEGKISLDLPYLRAFRRSFDQFDATIRQFGPRRMEVILRLDKPAAGDQAIVLARQDRDAKGAVIDLHVERARRSIQSHGPQNLFSVEFPFGNLRCSNQQIAQFSDLHVLFLAPDDGSHQRA